VHFSLLVWSINRTQGLVLIITSPSFISHFLDKRVSDELNFCFQLNEGVRMVTSMIVCESCLISMKTLFLLSSPLVLSLFLH
jgi:hypothetical protein